MRAEPLWCRRVGLKCSRRTARARPSIALLAAGLTVLLSVSVLAGEWYVDVVNCNGGTGGSGTQADPFCRIQDAINAAWDGDTIHIAPGTYYENLIVDRDLMLVGTVGRKPRPKSMPTPIFGHPSVW